MKKMTDLKIKCPHCGGESSWQDNSNRPFCSEKCRLIDLGHWADAEYRIDGGRAPQREEEQDF